MRLKEIEWENGKGAEDVVLWGVKPIKWLLELFDRECIDFEDENSAWFYYAIKDKLEELEEYLMKVDDVAHNKMFTRETFEAEKDLKKKLFLIVSKLPIDKLEDVLRIAGGLLPKEEPFVEHNA